MTAEQFLQNQDYNYLNKFTKYDMIKFAELYHESERKQLLIDFIKWVTEQPKDVLKTNTRAFVDIYLKPKL